MEACNAMVIGKAQPADDQDADCTLAYIHQHMLKLLRRNRVGKNHVQESSAFSKTVLEGKDEGKLTFMRDS